MIETKIEIADLENPTTTEEVLLQNNDIALSTIHDAIDERTFEQIKNIEIVTPSVIHPKSFTKTCHEHHVYVLMHVMECVDKFLIT